MSPVQALIEAELLIRRLSHSDDLVAELHESAMPALREVEYDFSLDEPDSEALERERVLSSVRRGLRILEHTSGFATLIPHVGSNLVECLPGATDVEDVAGVPGRLFDVKGRARVPASPEFGVSEYVATVLLAARAAGSEARAALNVRYDPDIVDQLVDRGLVAVEFEAEGGSVGAAVETVVSSTPEATVLYQTGGFGVEPIVYLLAGTASEAAEIARDLR